MGIVPVGMSKSATRSGEVDALAASSRAVFDSLFARPTRSPAAHFSPPFIETIFRLFPTANLPESSHFLRSVLSRPPSRTDAYSQFGVLRRFSPSFVPGLCSVAPRHVALRQRWERTALGAGKRRLSLGTAGCRGSGSAGTHRRCAFTRSSTQNKPQILKHILLLLFLDKIFTLCVKVFACKHTFFPSFHCLRMSPVFD